MKNLDFSTKYISDISRIDYNLHGLAENMGKNLLIQWGIKYKSFKHNKMYKKVWQKGKNKPDVLITYRSKSALLDWNGRHLNNWIINKKAVDSYFIYADKLKIPVVICFFVFDDEGILTDRRFAFLSKHNYIEIKAKHWNKNKTVEFKKKLPVFTKENLLNHFYK